MSEIFLFFIITLLYIHKKIYSNLILIILNIYYIKNNLFLLFIKIS